MKKEYKYKAYGIIISSEFEIPEFLQVKEGNTEVFLKIGEVPSEIEMPIKKGVRFQASKDEFLLKIDNVASYYVTDGKYVTVQLKSKDENIMNSMRLFLLGSVFAALFHQRKKLVIHGSAVEIGGEAVLFVGASGAGKSTTAGAFKNKGYRVITDDVAVIDIIQGVPYLIPGFPSLKLWQDSLEMLGKESSSVVQVRDEIKKYRVNISSSFKEDMVRIGKIYCICPYNEKSVEFEKVLGMDKLNLVINNTYRMNFLKGQGGEKEHFIQSAALANAVEIKNLCRPKGQCSLEAIVEKIEGELVNQCQV